MNLRTVADPRAGVDVDVLAESALRADSSRGAYMGVVPNLGADADLGTLFYDRCRLDSGGAIQREW